METGSASHDYDDELYLLVTLHLSYMKRYLYFTVFITGMITLALELTASRLLGSTFGTSNLVWASIIGLILIYLTVGYFLGGWWADRSPYYKTMYTILAWGAFLAGMIPLIASPVLNFASNAFDKLQVGVLFGSFAVVLVLFSLPVILLGTISPFAIRLSIHEPEHAGQVSGQIYAISTLGSFIGTFLPVLLTIPLIGTRYTFVSFSALLLGVALVGLGMSTEWLRVLKLIWMPFLLLLVALFLRGQTIKSSEGMIYETESAYNYIQVLEVDGYRLLRLNEGQGVHSIWHPTRQDYYGPWEQFLAAPYFNPDAQCTGDVESVAIVGLAGGTIANQATRVFGPIPIDGFEIDPKIVAVGREYFDMNMPNLNAIVQDGRWGLDKSGKRYSLIALDAYRPPYIPWHLTTVEFFQIVRDHLTEDGVVAVNVGHSPSDHDLIEGIVATMRQVFPAVYVADVPDTYNSLVIATVQPTKIEDLYKNYILLESCPQVDPLLLDALRRTIVYQQPTPDGGRVFYDDLAPIEWITNQMVLNFLFSGDMETIKQ